MKQKMMTFLAQKVQNRHTPKKVGTPTKKIKLNQDNKFKKFQEQDWQIPLGNLVFIKNISHTQQPMIGQMKRKQSKFEISDFRIGQSMVDQNKENDSYQMNKRKPSEQQMNDEKQLKLPSKLTKRINSMQKFDQRQKQYDHLLTQLSLTKHNSTFPVVDFTKFEDDEEFGQNIYLNQLLTLKAKISLTDANNQNREILRRMKDNDENKTEENRLEQDYEIKENLGKVHPNKEGFICLNKLERIFYYVKKTSLTKNTTDPFSPIRFPSPPTSTTSQPHLSLQTFLSTLSTSKRQTFPQTETSLICQQIKLYNKDPDSYLTRFYQEWIENNSVYMIYELGSYSVADKTMAGQKLPQSEVWSVIYECVQGLKWMHDSGKVHMNIKPGNIIKSRFKYKLADPLALQDFIPHHKSSLTQTSNSDKFYLAPELIQFHSYLQGIDFTKCQTFSLGMSILQNITSMPRSMRNSPMLEIRGYFKKQMQGYSSYLKRLLLRMVDTNYNQRPTFEELLCSDIEGYEVARDKGKGEGKGKRSNSV